MRLAGLLALGALVALAALAVFAQPASEARGQPAETGEVMGKGLGPEEVATLGGGCFWCLEAVYERVQGVLQVTSGYAGGSAKNPTYEQVSTGRTGHAEVVQVVFDPRILSYEAILEVFWSAHDPTTRDRQGADVGPQYRSIILVHDEAQRRAAEKSRDEATRRFSDPIVTEIKPLDVFYPAEDYHQNYYENNPFAGYCTFVIRPKLEKLHLPTDPIR